MATSSVRVEATGKVHGGQQPVVGAAIQLYSVGLTGDGSAATPLLSGPVMTGPDGGFSLNGLFSCQVGTYVYLVATGGVPGGAGANPNLALMTALGACGTPAQNEAKFIFVNEVTTVAAVAALAPYMASPTNVGSGTSDAADLASAFALALSYADSSTGVSPGPSVPTGTTVPTAAINTLANILAACVNSSGGIAGDPSICGQLFSLSTPLGSAAPTNTVTAMLNLAANPGLNTAGIYSLALPTAPFQPTLTAQPADFSVSLLPTTGSGRLTASVTSLVLSATPLGATTIEGFTVTNTGTVPVIYYGSSYYGNPVVGVDGSEFNPAVTVGGIGLVCPGYTTGYIPYGYSIAPGVTCQSVVFFVPQVAGLRRAAMIIPSSAVDSPKVIPLLGYGLGNTVPSVTLSAPTAWTVGHTLQDQTLTNGSTTTLVLGNNPFLGAEFEIGAQACFLSLPAMSSCTYSILSTGAGYQGTSSPTYYYQYTGSESFLNNAISSPQTYSLSSTNAMDVTAPTTGQLVMGTQTVHTSSSTPGIVTMAQLAAGSYAPPPGPLPNYPVMTITGANASDFSVTTPSCPNTAATCSWYVTFTPSGTGPRTANLVLNGGPFHLQLLGTGN